MTIVYKVQDGWYNLVLFKTAIMIVQKVQERWYEKVYVMIVQKVCVDMRFLYKIDGLKYKNIVMKKLMCTLAMMIVQKVQERWYEKLHEWEKALNAYERQQEKNPDDSTFLLGRMRCLEALGEWSVVPLDAFI